MAPQLDAVSRDTQVVTMTIGGDDSGVFINSILRCGAAGLTTLGKGSPCRDQYGSSFEDTIRTRTYPPLVQLRAAGPGRRTRRSRSWAIPPILPATRGCFPLMPVAEGDVPHLRGVQATLKDAIRRAAKDTGVTFVDLSRVSEGHDACQPIGVRWIEQVWWALTR